MIKILDIKIDEVDLVKTLSLIKQWVKGEQQKQIATVNPEFVMAAQKNPEFKNFLNQVDLSTCDGIGLVWASGGKLTRVTGVDLVFQLFKTSSHEGFKFYLLGGKLDTADKLAKKMRIENNEINIVGAQSGGMLDENFQLPENEKIIEQINQSEANILLVAFGQVKQELWLKKNLPKLKTVKVAIGVGGTFDYLLGSIMRAPKWLRVLGLEWLYRLIQEPKRLNRIFTATVVFPIMVLKEKFYSKKLNYK